MDFIDDLFEHQGVKGDANESALRDLLTRFIPGRYGVGTGIVVDRTGRQSRQCDVVVYDRERYPSLLDMAHAHMFPVDLVYAVVEVKTTLSAEKAKEALANIASVRELDPIPDSFVGPRADEGGFTISRYEPSPPMGVVFAYNSTAKRFETFKEWFVPGDPSETARYPTLVSCLDIGSVKCRDIDPKAGHEFKGATWPVVVENETDSPVPPEGVEKAEFQGIVYPVKEVLGRRLFIDQARVLLMFLLLLDKLLRLKPINPGIDFLKYYLPKHGYIEL